MKETGKSEFIKVKNLCSVKDNVKRMTRQAMHRRKPSAGKYSIKNQYPQEPLNTQQ